MATKKRVPDRVGMGLKTVFMTTKYGDVTVTDKYVQYPMLCGFQDAA